MKRNKVLFVIAIVAMLAVLFVACDDSQPEHTHTYGAWTIATAPTETEAGTATRVCSCGDVETATVAKLGDASVWSVKTSQDATHTSKGYKVYESAYGTVTVEVAKGEHTYGAWTITTEPTATEAGKAIRVCVCGSYEEAALAVLTDTSVWTKNEKQAQSDTEDGIVEYTSAYGKVTVTTPKAGHTYGAWTISSEPTETAAGVATRVCSCGDEQTHPVAKLTDTSVWTVSVNQEPSHTQGGVKVYTSVYGTVVKTSSQGAHTFGGWEITTDPTETATGVAKRYCSCGFFEQVTLPVLTNAEVWTKGENTATHYQPGATTYTSEYGTVTIVTEVQQHVFGPWVANGDGKHTHTCDCGYSETKDCAFNQQVTTSQYLAKAATCESPAEYYYSCVCGTKSAFTFEFGVALGHDYDNFQVTEATCTEDGAVTATCTREGCGHVYNKVIAKLGHDHEGGCVPYERNTMDEETQEDGSEHHVYRCSRCGAYDTENPEEHTFGEIVEYVLVSPAAGWHSVQSVRVCGDCGYRNHAEAFNGNFVESDSFFTKVGEKEADYNEAGYVEYTHKDTNTTFRIVKPKLTAPYEGVTYYAFELSQKEGTSLVKANLFESKVTFDENGTGVGNASPFRGNCTIKITDKNTGAITFTRVDGDSTYNERGYIDLSTGIVVMTKGSVYDSVYFMVPSTYSIKEADVNGAVWTDSMAISYGAECAFEFKHAFNFFVYDGQVYFGAKYTDFDGNPLEGADCATASYVKAVDAQGNKIQAFARNASGALQATDGLEGSYTDSTYKVVLNGVGGATIDGKAGVYVKATDKDYYELYVGESVEAATEYYTFTLAGNTISVTKPTATLKFETGVEGNTVDDVVANINVTTTLPTPAERAGYMFKGWKFEGAGTEMMSFKATVAEESYKFDASWTVPSQLTVKGLLAEDEAAYGSKQIGYGDTYVSALPNYVYNTTFNEGYTFVGWVLDNGDGVLGDDDADIQGEDVVTGDGANIVVFAKWEWAGNVSFSDETYTFVYDAANGYWASNNQGKGKTSAVMEFVATAGVVHVSFEYMCSSESGYDKLTIYYGPNAGTNVEMSGLSNSWTTLETTLDFSKNDTNQKVRFSYGKDGSGDKGGDTAYIRNLKINGVSVVAQNSLFENAGTYKNGTDEITVGAGGLLTIGANNYVYSQEGATVIGATVEGVYKEFTLDTTAKTYTETEPKVTVTYDYKGHGTNSSAQVSKYSNQTLSTDVPTADGFVFRGWYTDAELTTEAPATFFANADVTFYAKWDAAVTLTYKYLDGTTADVVENYYVNDTVATLKAVDFKFGTKVFAGWFTNDGSETGDYGTEFVKDTVLTANTTVYAKWIEPSVFAGTYTIVKFSNSGVSDIYNSDTTKIVVDVFGNSKITTWNGFSYGSTVSFAFAEGSTSVVTITVVTSYSTSKYYGVYDATTGVIVRADNASGFTASVFMMAPYDSSYAKGDFTAVAWSESSNYYKLVSYADKTAENATRTFFISGSTSVAFDATWTAVNASDVAVTALSNVKSNADMLTVVANGTTYKFAKDSSNNFVVTDGNEGTYTSGSDSVRLNGAGMITGTFNGTAITGTYKAAANDAGYGFDVMTTDKKATYTLSINKDDKSYTMAENRVTITYVNDKVTVESASVFRNVSTTLYAGDDLTVSGFKFRGWFDNAEFTGSAKTTVTPTDNATFYAKYDKVATLAFNFNGYSDAEGNTGISVADKYVGDTVGELPTVLDTVKYEGKAFAGWFLKNEDGSFGAEASTSTVLTGDLTYYAKWVDAPKAVGTYKGWNFCGSTTTGTKVNKDLSTALLTINTNGSYTGHKIAGTLTDEQAKMTEGAMVLGDGKSYHYVNATLGVVWRAYGSSNATGVGDDTYLAFNIGLVSSVDYSGCKNGNGGYLGYLKITYTDSSVKYAFLYDNKVVEVDSFGTGVDVKNIKDTDVTVYDKDNSIYAKVVGKAVVLNDGKAGVYTNSDAYGQIHLDGFGTITVGEATGSYTLDGDKVTFVVSNAMRIITLAGSAYTKTLDGYEGTYTLPDASTLALDGYGNVTGTSKTYVVNGTNITIYDGETSTAYGLDVANKELLGKSVFANYKFLLNGSTGKYIQFADSVDITGRIEVGYTGFYVEFANGVLSGNELTVTVTAQGGNMGNVGKTITFTVSGNTLTVKACPGLNTNLTSEYNLKVGTVYTCEGFSL